MSMRPFLSYISAIYPDPWSEALSTGKGRMVILGTSWDQAGDCGEYCRDIVAMTSFGKKKICTIQKLRIQILPFFHPLYLISASAVV